MNMKKTLSLLTAAALSISSFAALAVTSSAAVACKTENDMFVSADISRTGEKSNTTPISNVSITNSDYSAVFTGNPAITQYSSYTQDKDNDYILLNVTQTGYYCFYLLNQSYGADTKFELCQGEDNRIIYTIVADSKTNDIGTYTEGQSTGKSCYGYKSGYTDIKAGQYKVFLRKNTNGTYYSNIMAIKLHKMNFVEPIISGNTVKYNVSEGSGYGNSSATYNNTDGFIENSYNSDYYQIDNVKYYIFRLTFGFITLNEAFDKVTVCMGTNGSNPVTSIKVKVGGEQIAELTNINNTNNWNREELTPVSIDSTKKNLSGLLTIEATYTGKYAGNYEYVKFDNKAPVEKTEINKGTTSALSNTGSSYQRFNDKGGNPADAYMTSIDFNSRYAANGLKWYITNSEGKTATYGNLGTTFSGGTVYFGLVISGTETELNSITKVELK